MTSRNCVISKRVEKDYSDGEQLLWETYIECAIAIAAKQLGYRGLRLKQELAVKSFLSGRDVFVSFRTGSGKLLNCCFEVRL